MQLKPVTSIQRPRKIANNHYNALRINYLNGRNKGFWAGRLPATKLALEYVLHQMPYARYK
jgi:hypothetical protein